MSLRWRIRQVEGREGIGFGTAASADAADVVDGPEKDRDKKMRGRTRKRMLSAQFVAKAIGKETIAFPIS